MPSKARLKFTKPVSQPADFLYRVLALQFSQDRVKGGAFGFYDRFFRHASERSLAILFSRGKAQFLALTGVIGHITP